MSEINSTEPFSLKFTQEVGGANDFDIVEGTTEFFDNALDAKSNTAVIIATNISVTTGFCYAIIMDLGHGVDDNRVYYNLSPKVLKKSSNNRGLKNKGHISAVGRFNPDIITYFGKTVATHPVIMDFKIRDFTEAIKTEMDHGERNYNNVSHSNYMKQNETWQDNIVSHPVLVDIVSTMSSATLPASVTLFNDIIAGKVPSYSMMAMAYRGGFPEDILCGINNCIDISRLFYFKALQNGAQFTYSNLAGATASSTTITDKDALDPLGDKTMFPRIYCSLRVYEIVEDKEYCLQVQLSTDQDNSKYFWITDSQNLIQDARSKVKIITSDVSVDAYTLKTTMECEISCISKKAQDEQKNALASGRITTDELRGLYCMYHDRILGAPYWSKRKGWAAQRNMGGIRSLIRFTDQVAAEKFMAILCKKGSTNLDNAHPIMKCFFDSTIPRIANKYSHYLVRNTCTTGVTHWNLDEVFAVIIGAPVRAAAAVIMRPVTEESDNDTESDTDTITVDSESDSGSQDDDTVSGEQRIKIELTGMYNIIMDRTVEIGRLNNNGAGHHLRDYLLACRQRLRDDDKFISWVRTIVVVNNNNGVQI